MTKFKIAYIGQRGVPAAYSGVERYVDEIVRRLPKEEVETYSYCRRHYTNERVDYTTQLFIPSLGTQGFETFNYSLLCSLDALRYSFDIIHFQALGPSLFSCIPKIKKAKIVATVHGLDWQRAKWGKIAKIVLKSGDHMLRYSASAIISVSKRLKKYYEDKYRREVYFIPLSFPDPKIVEINKMSTKFGLEPSKYILFLSRLVPEKGAHYLIEAFKNIKHDKLRLVIAGSSSPQDKYVAQLKQLASSDPRIIFTGYVSQEEGQELYSNAYLFALPSELEGMPTVVLEALSHRCAVLISDIEESVDIIQGEDQLYGFIHKTKDVKDLQQKLTFLLKHPEVVDEMRGVGYDFVKKSYSWEKTVKMTYDVYKEVLND
jgi:glycosyltransferase involved in cell wall biosynthesis